MISGLLILLKILGILLLAVIGIVLLLALVVLFVPIRYRTKGHYEDGIIVKATISWLFHAISIKLVYQEEMHTSIRILGIPLSVFRKKTCTPAKNKKTTREAAAEKAQQTMQNPAAQTTVTEGSSDGLQKEKQEASATEKKTKKILEIRNNKCKAIWDKLKRFFDRFYEFMAGIKKQKENAAYWIEVFKKEEVKQAFSLCRQRLWIAAKHILPQQIKIHAVLGFENPATTGYLTALHSLLRPSKKRRILLQPDFENEIAVVDFAFKGSIRAWNLLYQLLRVIFDKNCRAFYSILSCHKTKNEQSRQVM